jgi:probable F420-dependent oxidoreductase
MRVRLKALALRPRLERALKFILPTSFLDPTHFLDMARAADESGWWAMAMSDHVVHPKDIRSAYPYTADGKAYWRSSNPWPDVWVSIGAMAAVTTRLRFFTNIFILPIRHPILVAKAVGTAAVLSHDRVALGVGVGWMREEFEILGQSFSTRGARTNEAIDLLRLLWRGGMVEHHGKHYSFGPLEMSPAPSAPIPIYSGGLSEAALRRSGERCDGWISVIHSVEEIRAYAKTLSEIRTRAGRGNLPFEVIVACNDAFDIDGYRRLEEAGATALITVPWLLYSGDSRSLRDKLDGIRRFADDVIAKV